MLCLRFMYFHMKCFELQVFWYVVTSSYNICMTVVGLSDARENMLMYLGTKHSKLEL